MKNMPWMDRPALELEDLFITHGTKHMYKKDAVFKFADERNEYMFYLQSGFCYTFTTRQDGNVNISRLLTKGSLFGEVSCVLNGAHSLTNTRAVSDSVVYTLKYDKLLELITGDKRLIHLVIESYAWRVGAYHISIFVRNTFSNEQKLALLFGSMHEEDCDLEYFTIPFSFTHQQIAELVGLARETVSRILSKWKEQGIISGNKNEISIKIKAIAEILNS